MQNRTARVFKYKMINFDDVILLMKIKQNTI